MPARVFDLQRAENYALMLPTKLKCYNFLYTVLKSTHQGRFIIIYQVLF